LGFHSKFIERFLPRKERVYGSNHGFPGRFGVGITAGVLCAVGASIAGGLVAIESFTALGLLMAGIVILGILAFPRFGFYLFLVSLFIPINYIERHFFAVPNIFRWASYILLLVTVVVFVFQNKQFIRQKLLSFFPSPLRWFGILLIAVSCLSAFYNQSSFVVTLLGLRTWLFLYGVFVLFGIVLRDPSERLWVLKLLLVAGLVQLPVTLIQRVLYSVRSGDMVSGTFTAYSDLMFLQLFCVVLVIIWWGDGQQLLSIHPVVTLVLLTVVLVLSNAKAAWLYLPVSVLFAARKYVFRLPGRFLGILVLLAVLVTFGAVGFEKLFQSSYGGQYSAIELITDPDAIFEYLFTQEKDPNREEMLARGEAIVYNWNLIYRDSISPFIGLGPGSLSHSHVKSGSFVGSVRTGVDSTELAITVGEFGGVGIFLLALLVIGLFQVSGSADAGIGAKFVNLRQSAIWLIMLLLPYYTVLRSPLAAVVLATLFAPTAISEVGTRDAWLESRD